MQITEVLGSISYILAQVDSGSPLSYLQEKFTQGGLFMWPILIVLNYWACNIICKNLVTF